MKRELERERCHLGLKQILLKLSMITRCSQELFPARPFILKTKHDTVSVLHSVEEDPSKSDFFLWSCSPPGLRGANEVGSELY